ncbi:MAG: S8 family serine peptidase [Desulfurococcaceae archaeon]
MLNETYGNAAFGYHGDVQVAVLDTGIDYTHEDLLNAVVYCIVSPRNGRIFYRGTNLRNCNDQNGHGTHVAGIIATRLNGIGVAGVAPKVTLICCSSTRCLGVRVRERRSQGHCRGYRGARWSSRYTGRRGRYINVARWTALQRSIRCC